MPFAAAHTGCSRFGKGSGCPVIRHRLPLRVTGAEQPAADVIGDGPQPLIGDAFAVEGGQVRREGTDPPVIPPAAGPGGALSFPRSSPSRPLTAAPGRPRHESRVLVSPLGVHLRSVGRQRRRNAAGAFHLKNKRAYPTMGTARRHERPRGTWRGATDERPDVRRDLAGTRSRTLGRRKTGLHPAGLRPAAAGAAAEVTTRGGGMMCREIRQRPQGNGPVKHPRTAAEVTTRKRAGRGHGAPGDPATAARTADETPPSRSHDRRQRRKGDA
jgi:hypothetical protein